MEVDVTVGGGAESNPNISTLSALVAIDANLYLTATTTTKATGIEMTIGDLPASPCD